VFSRTGAQTPAEVMYAFVDRHRQEHGSSPSAGSCRSPHRPIGGMPAGLRCRHGLAAGAARRHCWGARCTVERLMRRQGWRGVVRSKVVRKTISDTRAAFPQDLVNGQFSAQRSNQLWVSDFTYGPPCQVETYVALVIDVFAPSIVGWRVSSSMRTDFVLDALEKALYARQPERDGTLACHSDHGSVHQHPLTDRLTGHRGAEPVLGIMANPVAQDGLGYAQRLGHHRDGLPSLPLLISSPSGAPGIAAMLWDHQHIRRKAHLCAQCLQEANNELCHCLIAAWIERPRLEFHHCLSHRICPQESGRPAIDKPW